MSIEEKIQGIKEDRKVMYAGAEYEVKKIVWLFGVPFVEIYDEPPSKHLDRIKVSSVDLID